MEKNAYDVVICGAGIAGVSAAYYLTGQGITDILLVDELPPLNLTSSRSTECYRNWWPDPVMLELMNHSIDNLESLADESGNIFSLNRRGYLYVTGTEEKISDLEERARKISALGAGPLRIHTETKSHYIPHLPEGYSDKQTGADLIIGSSLIHRYFPYLTEKSIAALHVRRAGWLSAQQLGMYLFESSKSKGVQFRVAKVVQVEISNDEIKSIELSTGEVIKTRIFINAGGPYFKHVGRLCNIDLPVITELHLKVAFRDKLSVIDRDSPLLIWDDPQMLEWGPDEVEMLAGDLDTHWLTEQFPSGAHTRPEGGPGSQMALMLWEYQTKQMEPCLNPPLDEYYPEVALRGMSTMIPALKRYFGHAARPLLDGGFYTKSMDNRPIVGTTPIKGVFVIGALSGYGIMAACGVGELLASHVSGSKLPPYSTGLSLERFEEPGHIKWMEALTDSGQL